MRHLLLLAALIATPSAAQPGPPHEGMGGLFISPSGEPFRGGEGRQAWFARADTDPDGALTLAEFRADAMTFFKVLDANGDGKIDGFENQAYETRIAPEITRMSFPGEGGGDRRGPMGGDSQASHIPRGGGRPGGGPQRGAPREGAARYGLLNEPQPVRGADADLDWKITAEEWAKTAGKRFAILDTDGDGKLILATLPGPPTGPRPPR
ncbi:MAG: hypothetical protein KA085_11555 [Phenylobacterium sp.]|uniref:hypothetical protein n=1 Tax=Phenylobacterium sp. TaxID=1871053 RepID=UPI001B52DC29|nr:hypothetical protein [Phenylobacterium sp.]MBP7651595.1 hypothetical protein [Phenylobacterium sp.]MBP7816755.1 hypothetical protein [Phenylobacterium sp.]MBP9232781.1 hypothetical protein [Phenylobacterium sp.]